MDRPNPKNVRLYSLEEANELLPQVRERIGRLREAVSQLRFARGQLGDLEQRWTEGIRKEASPMAEEYRTWQEKSRDHAATVEAELAWFEGEGIEVKDPVLGLVDFYHDRDGELVYLCWKEGEERIEAWHSLEGGFQGRRPIEEL